MEAQCGLRNLTTEVPVSRAYAIPVPVSRAYAIDRGRKVRFRMLPTSHGHDHPKGYYTHHNQRELRVIIVNVAPILDWNSQFNRLLRPGKTWSPERHSRPGGSSRFIPVYCGFGKC